MKISKLFHWLYAFLMFLPIVLFIPNAFYYGFNEHATNSETTTINYKYQSNEVNSVDDLVEGNIYFYEYLETDFINSYLDIDILLYERFYLPTSSFNIDEIFVDPTIPYSNDNNNKLNLFGDNGNFYLGFTNSDSYANIEIFLDNAFELENFVFQIKEDELESTKTFFSDIGTLPQYTDYNVIESVEINTNDTISNKMYQAWQSTWNLPLLQWTHTSFVAQPFTYITGLFGVPSDSTLNYIFAYFVSISICWLVFDLIMYVPNLAHRWLDKGALE